MKIKVERSPYFKRKPNNRQATVHYELDIHSLAKKQGKLMGLFKKKK
jgi:hypothetical protein